MTNTKIDYMFCSLLFSPFPMYPEIFYSSLENWLNYIPQSTAFHLYFYPPSPNPMHTYRRDVAVATFCEEAFKLFYYYILKKIIAEGIIFKIEEI